jgi:hypothetical protein
MPDKMDKPGQIDTAGEAKAAKAVGTETYHLKGTSLNGFTQYASVEGEDLEAATAAFQGMAASQGETFETIEEVNQKEVEEANAPPEAEVK